MCIVAIAWQVLDEMPLCLISNRDEFYQRQRPLNGIFTYLVLKLRWRKTLTSQV
jgi:hypothetical protein